jgi:GNAT superfamily N-acetyltransferase
MLARLGVAVIAGGLISLMATGAASAAEAPVTGVAGKQGLGRALLRVAEQAAAEAGAGLLLLDTQTGSAAEGLYRGTGWTEVGVVPDYAADPAGTLQPTTFFYKRIS